MTSFSFRSSIIAGAVSAVLATSAFAAESTELFSWEGKTYSLKKLEPRLQQAFYDAEVKAWEQQSLIIDEALFSLHVDQMAAKDDRSVEETERKLLEVEPVTDAEAEAFYNDFKDRIQMPLEQVKPRIKQELQARRQMEKYQAIIAEIKKAGNFSLTLPQPESPTFDIDLENYAWKGAEDAQITIVEFADYRCGYCKTATEAMTKIMADYPGKLKLYHVDYPVVDRGNPEGLSAKLARGASCLREQDNDAFWKYNTLAFDNQSALTEASPAEFAKQLKMDMGKFNQCVTSEKTKKFVADSKALGDDLGVTGTPTFFINGKRIHTHDAEVDVRAAIESTLKK